MSGNRGEYKGRFEEPMREITPLSSREGRISSSAYISPDATSWTSDNDNGLLQRFNSLKSSSENKGDSNSFIAPVLPLLASTTLYSITPEEKTKITAYLDMRKDRVNFLKKRLIDLLLDLVFKNIDTQLNLAINDRSNAYSAYNTFNTTDLYNYDLNDFVHYVDERYNDYKEINEIVYKLKFINIIYLILQNNASLGVSPREYKEPAFKYKDLITQDILNGEKGLNVSSFKKAYTEFRTTYPVDKKEQSLPAAKGVVSNFQIDHIKIKLQQFITVYNLHQPDEFYKLKNPENGDDIENLKYLQPAPSPILFQNDTRWDSWEMHKLDDSEPVKNYIKESFKDKLIGIDSTISLIKEDNPDYAKYTKQLLNQISFAEKAINQTATETSKPTTQPADILTELNKFIKDYNNAIKDKSLSLQEQGTKLSNLQFAKPGFRNLFNNDTRWDSWKPPKDTTPPEPFIQLNMRNILVRINNAISEYIEPQDDYLKIYLLEQIAVAQSFISKKLDKDDLFKEVNYKLTNFILTYNKLIPDNYILQDINTSSEIKELKYEFGDDIKFEKKNWDGWDDTLKKEKGIKNNSMKDPLININTAIKALQKAIIKNNNDETITKIDILEKKIDDAIDFIGLDIYIPGDAKRIEEAKQKFTKGDNVRLTGLSNPALNNKEATVVEYFKNADMWSVSYNDEGINKVSSVRSSKMLKISPPPVKGGNPPTKYKSTGITVSIMYEKKKYKRTVYTKGNTKTKYCKIDGEYILLSKIKNLSNKNPQRTSPKSRGGLGEDGDLNTKIKTYLDDSVGTVNFLKHRLVYKLLEYMNSTNDKLKFDKDSTNVFEVYESFKDQGTKGLYVYDLKSFKLYDKEDKKYKEIDNIVYKLKLINIVYLILKNNSSQDGKLNEYKGYNFKYELISLFKEEGTERALDQDQFKVAYQIWVSNNDPIENKKQERSQIPDVKESKRENIMDKLTAFILLYNSNIDEKYKLLETDKFEQLTYKKKLTYTTTPAFDKDTRWDSKVLSTNMKEELIAINSGIISFLKEIKDGNEKRYLIDKQGQLTLNTNIDEDTIHNAIHDALDRLKGALESGTVKIIEYNRIRIKLQEFIQIYNYIESNINYQLEEQNGDKFIPLTYKKKLTYTTTPAFNDDKRWVKWDNEANKNITTKMHSSLMIINNIIISLNDKIKKGDITPINEELIKLEKSINDAKGFIEIKKYDTAKAKIIDENKEKYKNVKILIKNFIKSYNDKFKSATITDTDYQEITELKNKGAKVSSITFINEKIAALHLIYAKQEEVKGKDFQDALKNLEGSIVSAKHSLMLPKAGGNPPTKYKSTGITVYILYEKKKYKRTVYTKDNRKTKYCKINNKYILLSKLNVVE